MNARPIPFSTFLFLLMFMVPAPLLAQGAPAFRSTEIQADGRVSFRYYDAAAGKAALALEGVRGTLPMTREANGVWTFTSAPLKPGLYGYHFEADGQTRLDPQSTQYVQNLLFASNWVEVPGEHPQLWDEQAVAHGTLHRHGYTTDVVSGLKNRQSEYFVYTPAGYDPKARRRYPVLYLLHGWSDRAGGWSEVGRAHVILDNLIASGKAVPMVVVMPLGYGEMSFVEDGFHAWDDRARVDRNVSGFERALLEEVMPRVESEYRVSREARGRAIAGLSMGGLESLTLGLNHPETFAWVGGFSAAVHDLDFASHFLLGKTQPAPRLLWIACGRDEELLAPNRKLVEWLKQKKLPVSAVESDGMHNWLVWRENLASFAPLLFRE